MSQLREDASRGRGDADRKVRLEAKRKEEGKRKKKAEVGTELITRVIVVVVLL